MISNRTLAHRFAAMGSFMLADSACIEWPRGRTAQGYGSVAARSRGAHAIVWQLANGPIPDGLQVRHLCGHRPCVNLAHLAIGTNGDNVRDAIEHGTHWSPFYERAKQTRKLTVEQVREVRSSDLSQRKLARRYNVNPRTIFDIIHKNTYKEI